MYNSDTDTFDKETLCIYRMKGCPSFRGLVVNKDVLLPLMESERYPDNLLECQVVPSCLLEKEGASLTREEALLSNNSKIREIGRKM